MEEQAKELRALMNEDNLVARTNIPLKNEDVLEQAKEIITYLTINSSKANYLPIYLIFH